MHTPCDTSQFQELIFCNMYKINETEFTAEGMTLKAVIDKIEHEVCDVLLNVTQTDGNQTVLNMTGFTYSETWENQDVLDWALNELEQYRA